MQTLELGKLIKKNARTNKRFKAATKAQKRVMIARDVIKRLEADQYRASQGTWLRIPVHADLGDDAQQQLTQGMQCQCCALGAVFASCTVFNDNQTVGVMAGEAVLMSNIVGGRKKASNGIMSLFSGEQLELIESAFERGYGTYDGTRLSVAFGERYKYSLPRMIAIMKNIIKNKGTFKP
jgi:hypothetical protein